jgi:predicted transcriptional regulator
MHVHIGNANGMHVQMVKRPFTTRMDDEILELAQRLAEAERRSVTSLIEVAILEYAERRGEAPPKIPSGD